MLWVALHFPQLRLQALSRGHALPEPEREALEAVAAWACRYTPRVSLEPPQGLLLEVAGSLRYYGGRNPFLKGLRAGLAGLGFEAAFAFAPTAQAAAWRAAGGGATLEDLPVHVACIEPEALELLAGLGIRTLGELLRLPREGVARRFGPALLEALDRARGAAPEARRFFTPPERFAARLELPAPAAAAERILFAARRLLIGLEGCLAARQAGVRRFCLELEHRGAARARLEIGCAAPTRDAAHFTALLRERLARTALAAPVEAIRVEAEDFEPLLPGSGELFGGGRGASEQWLRLVERLQARLGGPAVHGLCIREDHRPEYAFSRVTPGKKDEEKFQASTPRPLWLVEPPRRLGESGFVLLAGPERIESGWWDDAEAKRDYFIARLGDSLAWIYREREGDWFLHGLFA